MSDEIQCTICLRYFNSQIPHATANEYEVCDGPYRPSPRILAAQLLATCRARIDELQTAIRTHRDQKGDDRCFLDDEKLYGVLPEGIGGADLRLHEPSVMRANCERYIAHRHNPSLPYVSPQREIEALTNRLTTIKELLIDYRDGAMSDEWALAQVWRLLTDG